MQLCHSSWASSLGFSIRGNGKKKGYLLAEQAEVISLSFHSKSLANPGISSSFQPASPGRAQAAQARQPSSTLPPLALCRAPRSPLEAGQGDERQLGGRFSPELGKRGWPCKPGLVGAIGWLQCCVKAEWLRPAFPHSLRHGLLLGSGLLIQL